MIVVNKAFLPMCTVPLVFSTCELKTLAAVNDIHIHLASCYRCQTCARISKRCRCLYAGVLLLSGFTDRHQRTSVMPEICARGVECMLDAFRPSHVSKCAHQISHVRFNMHRVDTLEWFCTSVEVRYGYFVDDSDIITPFFFSIMYLHATPAVQLELTIPVRLPI